MNVKKICKYDEKSLLGNGYVRCQLDGSVRKNGCPCNKRELSWWQKFKQKLGGKIIINRFLNKEEKDENTEKQ